MNERQRFNAQEQARDLSVFYRGICQGCGRRGWQMAHRIGKGTGNRAMVENILRRRGLHVHSLVLDAIMHHPLNLVLSCDTCNSGFNIGNDPEAVDALLSRIWTVLRDRGLIRHDPKSDAWKMTPDT